MQPILFTARGLSHLRRYGTRGWAGIEAHLTKNGLDDWVPYMKRSLTPYLRFRETWGDHGCAGPLSWREKAVWQAARRVVGDLLGISPRTLRLRLEESDHFGEHLPPLRLEDFDQFGQPVAR